MTRDLAQSRNRQAAAARLAAGEAVSVGEGVDADGRPYRVKRSTLNALVRAGLCRWSTVEDVVVPVQRGTCR